MLYAGISQHDLIPYRVKRIVFVLQSFTIQPYELSLAAEARCELLHYTAFDSAIIVFGILAYAGKFEQVESIFKKIVQPECEAAFQCGV